MSHVPWEHEIVPIEEYSSATAQLQKVNDEVSLSFNSYSIESVMIYADSLKTKASLEDCIQHVLAFMFTFEGTFAMWL